MRPWEALATQLGNGATDAARGIPGNDAKACGVSKQGPKGANRAGEVTRNLGSQYAVLADHQSTCATL